MAKNRPAPDYTTGAVTRGLRVAALIAVVTLTGYILWRYPSLPEVVPTHFDLRGQADDFGSRSSVLWLAGIMSAIGVLVFWLSTKPHILNYPGDVTEANAQRLYREGERLMVWLFVALAVVYLGIVLQIFAHTGSAVLVVGLVGLMASTLAGLVRLVIAETPVRT